MAIEGGAAEATDSGRKRNSIPRVFIGGDTKVPPGLDAKASREVSAELKHQTHDAL